MYGRLITLDLAPNVQATLWVAGTPDESMREFRRRALAILRRTLAEYDDVPA